MASNRRWRFGFAVERFGSPCFESAAAQLFSLGGSTRFMKLTSIVCLLFSIQLCWSQGTLVWSWSWTGTNDTSDVGSGLLTTSLDQAGGAYQVLDASGSLAGYAVTGVTNYRSGFYPAQTLGLPLGTSGGTNFTQFIFTLSQSCSEMIQVSVESVFPSPINPGVFFTNYPTAVSSFQSGSGAYSPINYGIFSVTPEPTPEPSVGGLVVVAAVFFFIFRNRIDQPPNTYQARAVNGQKAITAEKF